MDGVFVLQKRLVSIMAGLEVDVEAYLRNYMSYLSHVNTYFH